MKGAKGGNRDRIISWLFAERTRKKREEEFEIEEAEENKIDEKRKERRKNQKTDEIDEIMVELPPEVVIGENSITPTEPEITLISAMPISDDKIESSEKKDDRKQDKDSKPNEETEISLIDNQEIDKTKEIDKQPPTLFIDEEIVEEIKERNKTISNLEEEEIVEPTQFFPEVEEVTISEEKPIDTIEKPELLQVSIIEEIDNLLRNDVYDLRDIKYKIDVLNEQEKDEVLLENIEKIQKELEELIRRFEEIKKKYDYAYSNISVKDIDLINDLDLGFSISDYIVNGKNNLDNSTTLNQIHEIEEFIEIINSIIEIEKQKDIVQESIDDKLVDFSIRDDEFIKLQDQYADIEGINNLVDKYNGEMDHILLDLEAKIANNTEITKKMETTFEIVPDVNRMLQATIMLASTQMIPPTPAGNLFRATLFVSAAHMMATAFTPREETKEIVKTTVTDYTRDILNGKDTIKDVLGNIEDAFSNITYMKDTFEKQFSEYRSQIPEYDELIKNIFAIEKELERQQYIAYDYSNKIDQALIVNNQKVKRLENE